MIERSEWECSKRIGDAQFIYRVILVKLRLDGTEFWNYQTILSVASEEDKLHIRCFA